MKNKIILVVSSLVLLASCGTPVNPTVSSVTPASSTTTSSVVVTSTSVAPATAAAVLNKAMAAEATSDALGVKFHANLAAGIDAHIPYTAPEQPVEAADAASVPASSEAASPFAALTGSLTVSDFNVEVAAKGLTATDVANVAASAQASGSVKYSLQTPAMSEPTAAEFTGMSAAAYLANGNAYVDLSNEMACSFYDYVSSMIGGDGASMLEPGKYLKEGVITNDNLPLFSTSIKSDITANAAKIAEELDTYKAYLNTISYSDGSYAVTTSLNLDQVLAFAMQVMMQSASASSSAPFDTSKLPQIISLIGDAVTLNACQAEIRFAESGILSTSMKIDVAAATTLGALLPIISGSSDASSSVELPEEYASLKEAASLKFDFTATYAHGEAVSVASPVASEYHTPVTSSTPVIQ
jgi:hypothetical protein